MAFCGGHAVWAAVLGMGVAAAPALAQTPEPPIWVIEDTDSTVYMIGTVHMMREGVDWRSTAVADALAESEALWLEIPDLNPPDNIGQLLMRTAMSPDRPLSTLLDTEEREALEAILDEHGVPFDSFDGLRPWFAYLQLTGLVLLESGFDAEMGMDVQLKAEAEDLGIPVYGFETFESQFEVLSGMPEDIQLEVLRQTILEYDAAMEELALQLESWIEGDLSLMDATILEIAEATPEFYEILFAERNRGFADGIEEILEGEGTVLVAVGLGHFVGPDSLPEILEERGYTLELR